MLTKVKLDSYNVINGYLRNPVTYAALSDR